MGFCICIILLSWALVAVVTLDSKRLGHFLRTTVTVVVRSDIKPTCIMRSTDSVVMDNRNVEASVTF